MSAAIAWMSSSHGAFMDHVCALDDPQLAEPRLTNWGEMVPTRWLISTVATIPATTPARSTTSGACSNAATDGCGADRDPRERVRGIEPPFQAWEACVLPLNHTRVV
jgi:hypothetical protein